MKQRRGQGECQEVKKSRSVNSVPQSVTFTQALQVTHLSRHTFLPWELSAGIQETLIRKKCTRCVRLKEEGDRKCDAFCDALVGCFCVPLCISVVCIAIYGVSFLPGARLLIYRCTHSWSDVRYVFFLLCQFYTEKTHDYYCLLFCVCVCVLSTTPSVLLPEPFPLPSNHTFARI